MVSQTMSQFTIFNTMPSSYCLSGFSNLSLSCLSRHYPEIDLENEMCSIIPKFDSAELDWKDFGYLLNEEASTSSEVKKVVTVFQKPIEPIGKEAKRRRRRNADMEIAEIAAKHKSEVKKEVINPADITLGGDTYDYKEQNPLDSIATNVTRRRRTSANLSKSEDEYEKHNLNTTTRYAKDRRTSEPTSSRVTFYAPGTSSGDIDAAILHCICQQLFDPSKLYVSCDMCARWYHGECINITEKMCAKLEQWTCDQCLEEQERVKEQPALYCVCKKPYDDTKFYVGCDSCQGWFHPECVGTTREEAEQAAEYNCPNCIADGGGYESEGSEASHNSLFNAHLTRGDYSFVMELLELLLEHRMSTPFRNPIDSNECPDYEKVIKKPMDLTTISRKVEQIEYMFLGEFVNDVNLMFENAKTYNPKDNAVFKCAETMQEVFDRKLYDVRETMRARQQMLLFQQQQPHDPISSARKRVQSESQKTTDSLDIDSDQLLPLDANLMSQLFDY